MKFGISYNPKRSKISSRFKTGRRSLAKPRISAGKWHTKHRYFSGILPRTFGNRTVGRNFSIPFKRHRFTARGRLTQIAPNSMVRHLRFSSQPASDIRRYF